MQRLAPRILVGTFLGFIVALSLNWGTTISHPRVPRAGEPPFAVPGPPIDEDDARARELARLEQSIFRNPPHGAPRVDSRDGWPYGTHAAYIFPGWVGEWDVQHFWVLITTGVATFLVLIRDRGLRVPLALPAWFTFYAFYHSLVTVLFYETGAVHSRRDGINDSYAGAGAWLATALGLAAFVTALLWARAAKRDAPPAT